VVEIDADDVDDVDNADVPVGVPRRLVGVADGLQIRRDRLVLEGDVVAVRTTS
jgi:hypothetical protein